MLSLESVLGFCHGIAKGGDCKVEFNQPFYWLYSMPNLLVFRHLVTLYWGGFVVRAVSEIECWLLRVYKKTETRSLFLRVARGFKPPDAAHMPSVPKVNSHASWSTTRQNRTTGHTVISRLDLATQSSREFKPQATPVLWILTFHILLSLQYKYPLYPQMKESFQREFWERNPKEKQDWFTYNLYIRVSSNSSTLFLSIVKSLRGILLKPCSHHIYHCERAVWFSGK